MSTSIRVLVVAALFALTAHADAPRIRLGAPPSSGGGGGGGDPACELTGGADCVMTGQIRAADGTAGTPGFSFASDASNDSGFYLVGANSIGASTGGTLRLTLDTAALTSTLRILGPDGSASAPTYSFSSDTNTGIDWVSADSFALATGGTNRLTLSTTAITSTLPIVVASGSTSAAQVRASDADTGLFWASSDQQLKVTANGVEVWQFASTFNSTLLATYLRRPATNTTSDVGLSASSSANIIYSNTGASAIVRFTLPTGSISGSEFCFSVTDTDGIRVRPGTSQTIRWATNTVSTSQDLTSTTVGDTVCVNALSINADSGGVSTWVVTSIVGAGWSII